MDALRDTTTARQSELVTDRTHPPASNLVATWAQGRRRITPWAYPRMRALGATRLSIGVFLAVVGALLLAHGDDGWAVVPLAGAALNFSIGYLDSVAARFAAHRT